MSTNATQAFWHYLNDVHYQGLRADCLHREDDLILEDIALTNPYEFAEAENWPPGYPDVMDTQKPVRKNWSPYR